MKIAMLAPVEEQVPPKKYGGTELVVYNLAEELVKMGHDVTLFATKDSQTSAKLFPVFPRSIRSMKKAKDMNIRSSLKMVGVGKVVSYLNEEQFDIVHNHIGWMLLPFLDIIKSPVITTFHGFLKIPYQAEIYSRYTKANYVSISHNQRQSSIVDLDFIANVYNGIDVSKFKFFPKPKDYYAFLARISPEKGAAEAIRIAKEAGVKLIMAGKIDSVDEEYFLTNVKPHIDNKQVVFIGEVGHEEKVKLLGNAKALLAPIQWEEPFGLFFIESMACGTPVIATRRGSVPEIIKDKKTGYIVDTIEEAVKAIKNIDKIDRKNCFDHVNKNFRRDMMAKDYLEAYKKAIDKYKKQKT